MPAKRSSTQASRLYQALKERIVAGEFGSEDYLQEVELSAELGVSRTPVREALKRLENEGLLTPVPRKGRVVTTLDQHSVTQLYTFRELLEGGAARLAARHASDVQIDHMRAILQDCKRGGDPIQGNLDFHQTIYSASNNPYLIKSINHLIDSIALLGQSTLAHTGRPEVAYEEHLAIANAIAARDPDLAEQTARFHIRQALLARLAQQRRASAD